MSSPNPRSTLSVAVPAFRVATAIGAILRSLLVAYAAEIPVAAGASSEHTGQEARRQTRVR